MEIWGKTCDETRSGKNSLLFAERGWKRFGKRTKRRVAPTKENRKKKKVGDLA